MTNYLGQAVSELRPDAEFLVSGDVLTWLDDPALKPSDSEITVKIQEIQLRETKKSKKNELKDAFDNEFKTITGDVLFHEMVSWTTQEEEAEHWLADNTVETPFIDNLLASRQFVGETKEIIVQKIIEHSTAYKQFYASLLGKYQKLISQVDTANNIVDVENVAW